MKNSIPSELISSPGASGATRTRAGFTLVELMVVVAVMFFVMAIGVTSFRGGIKAASPTEAANLVSATVLAARSQALTLRTGSRIAIDAEYDPAEPDYYLRRFRIERKEVGPSGETWVRAGKAVTLPEGTFFSVAYSDGFTEPPSAGDPTSTSGLPPAGDPGPKAYVYEFDSAGRLVVPSSTAARMVFVSGFLGPDGELETPASLIERRNGFIIRRAGRVAHFESPDQIYPTQ